jgi:8-oxo-dGTP pyrophosphatase MutT (NUDIX family)
MPERIKLPVAVHLFLIKDRNILLLRRYKTGYEDGNYSVIAGHIDGNEHVYTAMIREAKEEAGINIFKKDLEIVQVMHRKKKTEERIDYFFVCKKWEGDIKIMEPNKCDELLWYSLERPSKNMVDYILEAVKNYKNEIKFSLFGWE